MRRYTWKLFETFIQVSWLLSKKDKQGVKWMHTCIIVADVHWLFGVHKHWPSTLQSSERYEMNTSIILILQIGKTGTEK